MSEDDMLTNIRILLKNSAECNASDVVILSVTMVPDGMVVVWRQWVNETVHVHRMTFIDKTYKVRQNIHAQVGR